MGIYDVSSTTTTNLNSELTEVSVSPVDTELGLYTPDWSRWHGYYKKIGRLSSMIDKVALWATSKGVKAKEANKQKIIEKIRGFGKDTIRDIVYNMIRTSMICGDSYAEILKNERGELINLKTLNPGTIQHVFNDLGMLIGYNQISDNIVVGSSRMKIKAGDSIKVKWLPEEIYHLCYNRIADEGHGVGIIEKIEDVLLKKKEVMDLMQIIARRNAKPIPIIKADTDTTSEMTELKDQYKTAIEKGEAMVVPKDTAEIIDFASTLKIDLIPWMNMLDKEFLVAAGVPEVILGSISSQDTEGATKIIFLAWSTVVKFIIIWKEEQWKAQIGFEIDLPEPPSLETIVATDARKAGTMDAAGGPNSMRGKQELGGTDK